MWHTGLRRLCHIFSLQMMDDAMNRLRTFALLFVAMLIACPLASFAADESRPTRIPTVTRLVKIFLDMENTLAAALQNGNAAAIDKLLLDDFELRVASMPANPTPRAEWIRFSLGKPVSFHVEQMAVHDFGDVAIVNFLQTSAAPNARDAAKDVAIVDVWKRAGDSWKLAVRYAGPSGPRDFVIPGAGSEPPIPKKY